jgi:hypothetical protein
LKPALIVPQKIREFIVGLRTDTHATSVHSKLEIQPYGDRDMKSLVIPMALLLALSGPALAKNDKGNQGNGKGNGGNVRGAPGPLVGAGLPVLLVAGGVYWVVRRRKKYTEKSRLA